ncbi:GIY-YIG nuclease family protein [Myxosarcina sp. GI1(2024)]
MDTWVNLPGYDYDCLASDVEYVYLISQGGTDAFKIGLTTVDPVKRLLALQTGNAERLSLAHIIYRFEYALADVETWLHYKLSHRRIRGEWFDLGDSYYYWLAEYKSDVGLLKTIE